MASYRRPVYFNPSAKDWVTTERADDRELARRFHEQLPCYSRTSLEPLEDVAKELGVRAVYVKNETNRFGLPAFKILGASWGCFRAIIQKLALPLDSSVDTVKEALARTKLTIYAASEGNHGRAVAYVAAGLGARSQIHVPHCMHHDTIKLIRSEGATVVVSKGLYDLAVEEAFIASKGDEVGVVVQDFAFGDYQEIPQWIVDGYSTMMMEVDEQLGQKPDLVVAPVGVGSFAQAVVSYFKQPGKQATVLTVEPDTSACLWKSLQRDEITSIQVNAPSIMAGLECPEVSSIAWPMLRSGVDASVSVSDYEAHQACVYLNSAGIPSGPCGASGLAALRSLSPLDRSCLNLGKESVVVLLCTERNREYTMPYSVSEDDPVSLTQTLVQINSTNPSLGMDSGSGETNIAHYIVSWMEHRDIETHWIEPTKGRPSVVGVARGSGGGKSLMFNGHIDTVAIANYEENPFSGEIHDGKLYGRGAADMKGGIGAAMVALVNAKQEKLRGDVIFTGVADEEFASIGTEQVLEAGWRADAAIVSEPTDLEILHAHKGFVWLEVDIHGRAAHGSRFDLGVDAICKAGYFLVELDKHARKLQDSCRDTNETLSSPSMHASVIKGGEEESSYPALCTIKLERRTVSGETAESVSREIKAILVGLAKTVPGFTYDLRVTFSRPTFEIPIGHKFTQLVAKQVEKTLGREARVTAAPFWTDCALLADEGIPALLLGANGVGLHAKEEYVEIESVKQLAEILTSSAVEFCS